MLYKFIEKNTNDRLFGFFIYQFLQLSNPFMPHIANELWQLSKLNKNNINLIWPEYDINIIKKDQVIIAVQINGKTRGSIPLMFEEEGEEELSVRISKSKEMSKFIDTKKIVKRNLH